MSFFQGGQLCLTLFFSAIFFTKMGSFCAHRKGNFLNFSKLTPLLSLVRCHLQPIKRGSLFFLGHPVDWGSIWLGDGLRTPYRLAREHHQSCQLNHSGNFYSLGFVLRPLLHHSCLKVYGWLVDFSVSPRPLGTLNLLGLGWGWAQGVWGLRV